MLGTCLRSSKNRPVIVRKTIKTPLTLKPPEPSILDQIAYSYEVLGGLRVKNTMLQSTVQWKPEQIKMITTKTRVKIEAFGQFLPGV